MRSLFVTVALILGALIIVRTISGVLDWHFGSSAKPTTSFAPAADSTSNAPGKAPAKAQPAAKP